MSVVTAAKKKVMKSSRDNKLEHFYSLSREGQTVLDVGVSRERKQHLPTINYFLKNYRYPSDTYTGLGVQDLSEMSDAFPGKRFVQYAGGKFPFENKQFDWAFSNAVIEHVGGETDQLLFLNEMMRVAHNVFFTTPSKYFPVEAHTNVFFLHWNNELFYRWCEKNHPSVSKSNLYLLSLQRLKDLLKRSNATSFSIHKNRFYGLPMTFTVTCNGT